MEVPYSRFVIGPLPWYSFLIVLGAAAAIWLAAREEVRTGLPKDTVLDLALRVLPAGIIGARFYYVVFSWSSYRENPISALFIWEGGLAIYGGLAAGLLTVAVFCFRRKLNLLTVCDTIVPGIALAQAVGRWGNYFNQEAYGIPVLNPRYCFFPLAVLITGGDSPGWHMATFFYESVLNLLIFFFLLYARRRLFRRSGDVFFAYLFLYGAARLIVENFRMDSLYAGGNTVRVSQLLSVLICTWLLSGALRRRWKEGRLFSSGLSSAGSLLCALSVLYAVPLLVFCLNPAWLPIGGIRSQCLFLAGFSFPASVGMLLLCLPAAPSEVPNADDKV